MTPVLRGSFIRVTILMEFGFTTRLTSHTGETVMAHELDFSTGGRAALAFIGERKDIWHGLGEEIDPARSRDIEYLLTAGGLQFSVEKMSLFYRAPGDAEGAALRMAPDLMANVRRDTGSMLGVVSDSMFNNVQPRQIVEFFAEFFDKNSMSISTLGSLKGGRIVWAAAKLGPEYSFLLPGNDKIEAYFRVQTGFDGKRSTSGVATTIRQVCANTERMIEHSTAAAQYVTRHSAVFDARQLQHAVGLLGEQHRITADAYNTLSRRAVTVADARAFFLELLNVSEDQITAGKISSKARNQFAALAHAFAAGPGAQLESSKGTAFGLLQSVTYYVDHLAATRDTTGDGKAASRAASAWYGNGAKAKERARAMALALAA